MRGGTATRRNSVRGAPAPSERPRRVLVIDEEAIVRTMLARYLPRMGYDAVAVRSCREACALLEGESWDAVVMSVLLPGGTFERQMVVFRDAPYPSECTRDIPLPRVLREPFDLGDLAHALLLVGATPTDSVPPVATWRG